ncbi:hypothetical protein D3C72_1589990 [compost metagenome]
MFFPAQVFGMNADLLIIARHQRGMGIQANGAAKHGCRMIDEEVGQVGTAAAETHAYRCPCPGQHRHLRARRKLAGINLRQALLGIDTRNGDIAKIEQFEQFLARGADLNRAELAIHARGYRQIGLATLQQVAAHVAIGHHANQPPVVIDDEDDLQRAGLDALDCIEDAVPVADAQALDKWIHCAASV